MGYQKDQSFPGETVRPDSAAPARQSYGPPLPPRPNSSILSPSGQAPPPYELVASGYHSQPLTHSWSQQDPRSSSTQSLVPPRDYEDGKRTLLLIYVHGFMGNETSFQSFPAHIHNLVTVKLVDTHVIHTKIYPRYKSRGAIESARDDFSNWLSPHESSTTDIVLLGHSMGGILATEVTLLPPYSPTSDDSFRHCILGTIDFDTPFLGMHPGVVVSGVGSLFRPALESPTRKPQSKTGSEAASVPMSPVDSRSDVSNVPSSSQQRANSQSSVPSEYFGTSIASANADASTTSVRSAKSPLVSSIDDPNYNPPFPNDVRIPVRKGWDNTLHFIVKHSDGLTKATKSYVTSHLEFGGCLADYNGLKYRYAKIRGLEDVNEFDQRSNLGRTSRRIRFINYYTASTGRPKKVNTNPPVAEANHLPQVIGSELAVEQQMRNMSLSEASSVATPETSRTSIEKHRSSQESLGSIQSSNQTHRENAHGHAFVDEDTSDASLGMKDMDPQPLTDDESPETYNDTASEDQSSPSSQAEPNPGSSSKTPTTSITTKHSTQNLSKSPSFPPLPPEPSEPAPLDLSAYSDKDARKLAEKDHSRTIKAYRQAVKDRDKAIKDRRKLLEKREKNARQEREKQVKSEEKQRIKEERQEIKRQAALDTKSAPSRIKNKNPAVDATCEENFIPEEKVKHDKKFCMLPSKNSDGTVDRCWVRVYMEGVDEVGAHVGLFFAHNPHYEKLVADVGNRIEQWMSEAADRERG